MSATPSALTPDAIQPGSPLPAFLRSIGKPAGYIVGPLYDSVFFLYSPLLALALGIGFSPLAGAKEVPGHTLPALALAVGSLTMAHLFIVFFRSHGNREIFKLYPLRFTLVPALVAASFLLSPWARAFGLVLATFWDVYHSSLQTFGLGRIYDRLHGNDARAGRSFDIALNHLLYIGPIVAGVTLMSHVGRFYAFESVGSTFFTAIPAAVRGWHAVLAQAVLAVGALFLLAYVLWYRRLARQGYRVSYQKVALLVSTGLCSIYAWGFNSFGVAFLVMNFFHAVQYFALVGYTERSRLERLVPVAPGRFAPLKVAGVLVAVGFGYGIWAELARTRVDVTPFAFAATYTVSLMHFWYDGFIWSVRKKQV